MNNFEANFFKKYTPKGQKIITVVHQHWVKIIGKLFFWLTGWVILPSFVYYYSIRVKELVPFYFFEVFLILIFIKIVYDIFDWYNDVWIITDEGVIDLDWKIFKTNTVTISYDNIEGIEVDQNGIWDKILRKGSLIIHKVGDETLEMEDCVKPYKAVDKIEEVASEKEDRDEDGKFNMVMETLSGVVEDYLERKGMNQLDNRTKYKEKSEKEIIKLAESEDSTIDIR